MQVKQSAARQSWHKGERPASTPHFSIAEKQGRYEAGDGWVEERSRNADLFIFAWHPLTGNDADQRDPEQWLFYVAPEAALPSQKSLSLATIAKHAAPVQFPALARAVFEATRSAE